MHRDKRLGLALGILLLGIVGAFFFRNEGNPMLSSPDLEDPVSLDEQIAENPVTPYLEEYDKGGDAPGWSAQNSSQSTTNAGDDDPWGPPDFLREEQAKADLPGASGPPTPIDTRSPTVGGIPIPRENDAWEPVTVDESASASRSTATQPVSVRVVDGYIIHRVKHGDTLSGLAQKYLGSSARFRELYEMNHNVLRSPDDLRLGMMIRVPAEENNRPTRNSSRREDRVEARPVTDRKRRAPKPKPAARPTLPKKPEAKPALPKKRFIPVRRSPLMPGGVRKRASLPDVPVDSVPRQLTQLPRGKGSHSENDVVVEDTATAFGE